MRPRTIRTLNVFLALLPAFFLAIGVACSRSPQYYLERGNKLFTEGKYADAAINFRKAILKDARFGEAYYGLGLTELKQGHGAEAYQALSRADEFLPNRQDIKEQLGEVILRGYFADRRRSPRLYEQLTKISGQLLAMNPNSFDGLRFQADLAATDGKLKEAAELFQKADAVRPMESKVVVPWVEVLMRDNRFPEAEKLALDLIQKHKDFGPIFDMLYGRYMATNRVAEAENLLKTRVSDNPKDRAALMRLAFHYGRVGRKEDATRTLQKLLDDPKTFPHAHIDVGDYYFFSRNWDEALRQFRQGLATDPGDWKITYQKRIIGTQVAQGKRDDALQSLDQFIQAQPKDQEARQLRAALLRESGKPEQIVRSIRELQELVKEKPDDAVLRYNFGLAYMAQGNLDAARIQFMEAAKRRPNYLEPRLTLAEIGERRKDLRETLRYANEVLAIDARNPAGKLARGIGLIGTGNYGQARLELNAILKDFPRHAEVEIQLGVLDLAEKKFKDAEERFRKLYQPGQADLRPLEGLADAYEMQKQFDKSIQLLDNELRLRADSIPIHSRLAAATARAGKRELAIEQYQWLIAHDPKNVDAYLNVAELYRLKGDTGPALASLQKAKALQPNNANVIARIALVELMAGQSNQAMADYRQQLALDPGDATAQNNLAFLLADTGGNLDEALRLVGQAQRKLPNDPDVADTLGWVYVKKNMNDMAIQIFSNVLRKFPDQPAVRYHLGVALFQKGDRQKAKAELETALSKQPSKNIAEKIKEAMAKIT